MSFRTRKQSPQANNPSAVVLSNESQELYAQMRTAYYERFQPADQVEADLVDRIVANQWRLERAAAMEAATINLAMKAGAQAIADTIGAVDPVTRAALAIQAVEGSESLLVNLRSGEGAMAARYREAMEDLRTIQTQRRQTEK